MSEPACATHTLAEMSVKDRYFLLTACILPRPIAFVTSLDRSGKVLNAAPFSYFNGVCSDPPLIILGLAGKPGEEGIVHKDTTRNILETGEFVVNSCSVEMAAVVQKSSENYPAEESEVEALGLATIPSMVVAPPRLAASPISFECRLYQSLQLGPKMSTLVLGEVLKVHVREDCVVKGRVDAERVQPLARLGGGFYSGITAPFKPEA